MFETTVGPVKDSGSVAYLRPETAQGIFINFKNVLQFARVKPPFGIAQIGKSFRNEITPGNFIFRTREFEQMEMEFFCPARRGREVARALDGGADALVHRARDPPDNLILRAHGADELSHYSRATSDIEYLFPMGWSELEGIANRGDFDLTPARRVLGREARVLRPADEGALRAARDRAGGRRRPGDARLPRRRLRHRGGRGPPAHGPAPAPEARPGQGRGAAARLPRRDARARPRDLRLAAPKIPAEYDEGGSIGKRYRRQDEIGTPWGVTIDGQTPRTAPSPCATATRSSRRASDAGDLEDAAGRAPRGALADAEARLEPPTGPGGVVAELVVGLERQRAAA